MHKIVLSGPAGSGRSTVAEIISREKGIPFLKAKDITTPILKRDGYDYASGQKVERFLQTTSRQLEIFEKTQCQQSVPCFITDRGFLDIAAYALSSMDTIDIDVLDKIVTESREQIKKYDHVFLFKLGQLIDNKKRTLCRHYQEMIYALELGLLNAWGIPYTIVENDSLDPYPKAAQIVFQVWN